MIDLRILIPCMVFGGLAGLFAALWKKEKTLREAAEIKSKSYEENAAAARLDNMILKMQQLDADLDRRTCRNCGNNKANKVECRLLSCELSPSDHCTRWKEMKEEC